MTTFAASQRPANRVPAQRADHDAAARAAGPPAPAALPRGARPSAADALALQRLVGNRAAGRLLREATPPKKTVRVFPVSLGSSSRDPYVDIKRADAIWSQCGVKVTAMMGQCSTSNVLDKQDPKNVLNEYSDPASPTAEETEMLALRPGGSGDLHAYYVPKMSANSRGEAFWPAVSKTSAVVVSDTAASDSLAHEIGHVLLDDGSHNEVDADDLMATGGIRNVGVDKLSPTQCAKAVK